MQTGPPTPSPRNKAFDMEHAPTWLINSLIYLSAAVIAVPLSKAVGLGAIIGYLAAGIAIGPWGAGLVSNVEDILHFAEFGVVLMLFLVGLELEPRRLWSLRRSIFGWGALQVLGLHRFLDAGGHGVWCGLAPESGRRHGICAFEHSDRFAGDGRAQSDAHPKRSGCLFHSSVSGCGRHSHPGLASSSGRKLRIK